MRVLIATFGTRGDIDPYAALAERLRREGHVAVLCAPEPYRKDVEALGVGFEPAGTEMHEIVRAGMTSASGPGDAIRMARRMTQAMRESLQEQWQAAQRVEPTLIVSHPKALAGFHIAERLGIPFVASLPLPFLTPTGDFPIPFIARSLPRSANRFSYQFNRFTAIAYGGMINRFRSEHLGLRRVSRTSDYLHRNGERVPVLYPISRHVVPRPTDFPDSAHITGYWFRGVGHTDWAAPPELETFLSADGPVVYVGFGSMGFGAKAQARGQIVLDAIRQVGARAIVATGWGGLLASSADDVHVIDDAPHQWLFPRVSAVVHHGGSGTTAAGLRAGRPTLICPILGDQPFWGSRIHELGAGPAPSR
ncbi:glycosyltransferase [Microbacterium sp. A93]|uniref:glycosyltransferase n=1 Tax=Microbacterium sp. A93 TaxID=3450716 RepID=UPI003F43E7BF